MNGTFEQPMIEGEVVSIDGRPLPGLPPRVNDEPWLRWPGEPLRWFKRFTDYLTLGPNRTISKMVKQEGQSPHSHVNWERMSRAWFWNWRAECWDGVQVDAERRRREEIMHSGLSLDVERVYWLKQIGEREVRLVQAVQNSLEKDPSGNKTKLNTRYQVVKSSLDSTLEALAKETGGRVKRVSISKDLVDWARQLAIEKGYDVEEAARVARLIAGDSQH